MGNDDRIPAIICDLDGTLALFNGRGPFEMEKCGDDLLNGPVSETVDALNRRGWQVLLVTGRFEQFRSQTEEWLFKHKVRFHALWMRADGDFRKDAIVKRELYEREIAPHYDVLLALDDRNQSVQCWRDLGLTCFQVAPGDF